MGRVLACTVRDNVGEGFYEIALEIAARPLPLTSCELGGTLIIHTIAEFPGATYRLWANTPGYPRNGAPSGFGMLLVADNIPAGVDFEYETSPGECYFAIDGAVGGGNTGFDGITWAATGGDPTYVPENGDGAAGHFFGYGRSVFTEPGVAGSWHFPTYAVADGAAIGGAYDSPIVDSLGNSVSWDLPS